MERRISNEIAAVLLLSSGLLGMSCERTAEGIKQDTFAATAAASDQAQRAQQDLQQQMDSFKAQTNAQLDRIGASLTKLEAQTNSGIDESRQKLQAELDETKAKLGALKAESGVELERAKSDLAARIADLGRRLNGTLDDVGDGVEKTLD